MTESISSDRQDAKDDIREAGDDAARAADRTGDKIGDAADHAKEGAEKVGRKLSDAIEDVLLKRGYGARNDRIAKYMQDTFKDHIEARKKLVQEVVSKGSASAETVDAAFAPAVMSPISVAFGPFRSIAFFASCSN